MKQLTIKQNRSFEPEEFVMKNGKESDFSTTINENTVIRDEDTGEIILVYMKLKDTVEELRESVMNIKYGKGRRGKIQKAIK